MPDWTNEPSPAPHAVLQSLASEPTRIFGPGSHRWARQLSSSDDPRRRLVEGLLSNVSHDIDYCLQLTSTAQQKESP